MNKYTDKYIVFFFQIVDNYRGSLPYATYGTGKNLHKPKIALGKYLANAIFGPKNAAMKELTPKTH